MFKVGSVMIILLDLITFGYSTITDDFPADFKFGCATAAYQVEGGWNLNGKGENCWDHYTHLKPNWITDHETGDITCDSYHKFQEDVALLKDLGVDIYRFSLSWSRILPTGYPDQVNPDGITYYNNLINELKTNGIEPFVTLYHWDLPQPLMDLGGWANPLMANYFYDYARVCFNEFGDRVKYWATFNEPLTFCTDGYENLLAPPRIASHGVGVYLCGHTVLNAHAKVYHLYDLEFRPQQKGNITIVINAPHFAPKTNSSEDVILANRAIEFSLGWFANPIYSKSGDYPPEMIQQIKEKSRKFPWSRLPKFTEEELRLLRGSSDFFSLNHYTTYLVTAGNATAPSYWNDAGVALEADPSWVQSDALWLHTVPWGFEKVLMRIKEKYNSPVIYVTENGFADKEFFDMRRLNYYDGYLKSMLAAMKKGCNVKAYITWSLMDNFEWESGFLYRFGLYYTNFTDPERTRIPRASAAMYKQLIYHHKAKLNLEGLIYVNKV